MIFSIRSIWGEVVHQVEVGDRKMQILGSISAPHWIDLRNLDFTNANLRGADLQGANLEGAILLGADLTEACLHKANLKNVDARYCDFTRADLRQANLENIDVYPSQFLKTHFWGAQMTPGSDISECSRIAQQENCKRMGIRPNSVAYRKLARINNWPSGPAPSPDIPPAKRGRPCWFFESL
jgi:Pentapeptide repeats (8 copies)